MNIQINLSPELNHKLKIYKATRCLKKLQYAAVEILTKELDSISLPENFGSEDQLNNLPLTNGDTTPEEIPIQD